MRRSVVSLTLCAVVALLISAHGASAQAIGTFNWQLQPFCNTLTLTVTQVGGIYRLDGFDGQCSAGRRAPASGIATLNPNGTVGLGITIVSTQGGQPVHVDAFISVATLGGSWTDNHGNAGTFVPGGVGDGPNILPIGASVVTKSVAAPSFIGRRGNGVAPGTAVLANSPLLVVEAQGFDGAVYAPGAVIRATTTENWTPDARGTRLQFQTVMNGWNFTTTRMTINHDGRVGIGITAPSQLLDVAGNVRIGGFGGLFGCVEDRDGTLLTGNCASDARFKRDIASFEPMLAKVAALRPVHFFWRAGEFPARAFGNRQSYGLIAQEVEQILPELVTSDEEGYKAVNYSKLPLVALQAIKELKSENDALKAQNTVILERLAALEARIATSANPR